MISVYIITYNEEKKIGDAINSVIDWVDEVVVIDSFSTDNTVSISASLGAKVVQIPFEGFGKLRNDAISYCSNPWIFSLDADERCTPEAKQEIIKIITENDFSVNAYLIPRKNFFLGQWIKYSGWYPDYRQPQLFRKGNLNYSNDFVHEGYSVKGKTLKLKNPIWQYPFDNLEQMINKTNRYSNLGAQKLFNKPRSFFKKGGLLNALLHGLFIFFQTYFLKLGFLDGRAGFVIAFSNCITTYYKYIKLMELENNWKMPERLS